MIEPPTTAVILVEGHSDATAVAVLAARSGISLRASGVWVVPMGGATNIGHHLDRYGPGGRDVRLAGLCDLAEQDIFGRALRRADVGAVRTRADLEGAGFGVCVVDLEDELIRAVGIERVLQILEAQGELGSFGTLQQQPAQRGRTMRDQLRRFISGRSGNKDRYAGLLADAVVLDRIPQPLALVLDRAREWTSASRPADEPRADAGCH